MEMIVVIVVKIIVVGDYKVQNFLATHNFRHYLGNHRVIRHFSPPRNLRVASATIGLSDNSQSDGISIYIDSEGE